MPSLRFQPPDQLPEATAFGRDRAVRGSENVVALLKSQRWVWDELRNACALDANWGRHREPGHWELVAAAFVVSGHVDIQPWHDNTTAELWRLCGFAEKPPYMRVWRRLRELEGCEEALINAIATVVQHARRHEPRIGAHVHIDGTEDETHAALVHDCRRDEPCPYREQRERRRQGRTSRAGRATRPGRVTTAVARADRQNENARAETESSSETSVIELVERGGRMIKRIRQRGCWYRTFDTSAGIRAYTGHRGAERFWHGYYNQKAIDHHTGGVLFPGVYNASVQEYNQFPDLYEKVTRILGAPPQTVIADKGQSMPAVFELCTRNGTAAVIPWRQHGSERERQDRATHDRHGIPRCRHCGGATTFQRFAASPTPRLWFKCLLPVTDECSRVQSLSCSTDWRLLLPLWRTDPLYQELRHTLGSFEAQHDYWRDRYKVAADSLGNRPKAVGIGWHQVRALTACLVEWLRICDRQGWLGSARRNERGAIRRTLLIGVHNARELKRARMRAGLMIAYGAKAAVLGLGDAIPPSKRPPPETG